MSVIRRLHVPLRAAEDVIPHLGKPNHWKEGRSAKCLVDQWWLANELPVKLRNLLAQAEEWHDVELVDAFVERQTSLDDGRPSHSQSDLLAITAISDRLGIVAIEAKVDEGFDKTVGDWLAGGSSGKALRLAQLCELFALEPGNVTTLRYQLFHRTAAAIFEARRYRAQQAVMIVQSWCPNAFGLADFQAFAIAVGLSVDGAGHLSNARQFFEVSLRLGWLAEDSAAA